jgi:hypothetical protein
MKKIKPSDLRREAQAMILDGSMPSLETLLQADAREKYAQQIKRAGSDRVNAIAGHAKRHPCFETGAG